MSEISKDLLQEAKKQGTKIIVANGFGVSTDTSKVLELLKEQGVEFEFDNRERNGIHETYPDPIVAERYQREKCHKTQEQNKAAKRNTENKKKSRAKMRKQTKKQQRRKK